MSWDRLHTALKLTGAALTVPAAAAGTYTAYRTYIASDAVCASLHGSILSVIERNLPLDTKRELLMRDLAAFEKSCSKADPDSWMVFKATVDPAKQPPTAMTAGAPAQAAAASPPGAAVAATPAARAKTLEFGMSQTGEMRGWVALMRREPGQDPESHFNEYAIGGPLPAAGTRLTARRMIPVWLEPMPPGPNQPDKLQGRLAAGHCVKVLATRAGPGRSWAEVAPDFCP